MSRTDLNAEIYQKQYQVITVNNKRTSVKLIDRAGERLLSTQMKVRLLSKAKVVNVVGGLLSVPPGS